MGAKNNLDNNDDGPERWCIAPKVFWGMNGYVPDWDLGFSVPGFYESQEHTLTPKMSLDNPREALLSLGFEIIDNPKWGCDGQ